MARQSGQKLILKSFNFSGRIKNIYISNKYTKNTYIYKYIFQRKVGLKEISQKYIPENKIVIKIYKMYISEKKDFERKKYLNKKSLKYIFRKKIEKNI